MDKLIIEQCEELKQEYRAFFQQLAEKKVNLEIFQKEAALQPLVDSFIGGLDLWIKLKQEPKIKEP